MKNLIITSIFLFLSLNIKAQVDSILYKNGCIQKIDTLDGMTVLTSVDQPPEFKEGKGAFYKKILRSVAVARDAKRMGIETKFIFTFVIDTMGNMRDFCNINKPNGLTLSIEDSIILKNSWTPAENKGKKVPARLIIPLIVEID